MHGSATLVEFLLCGCRFFFETDTSEAVQWIQSPQVAQPQVTWAQVPGIQSSSQESPRPKVTCQPSLHVASQWTGWNDMNTSETSPSDMSDTKQKHTKATLINTYIFSHVFFIRVNDVGPTWSYLWSHVAPYPKPTWIVGITRPQDKQTGLLCEWLWIDILYIIFIYYIYIRYYKMAVRRFEHVCCDDPRRLDYIYYHLLICPDLCLSEMGSPWISQNLERRGG